ncbi:hypothetical protein [Aliikangiella sp. IMCC44359]|uniref:hypothetical protein n=1 Tax=Aliikangiella sp. IMCC44359 TaxID=3459125 RepID=UPI00403A9110
MKFVKILILTLGVILTGCASNPMQVLKDQPLEKAKEGEAQVVFMRSSFVGGAINSSIFEIVDNEPVFVGILANGTKLAYNTKPGKHTFMVVSEAADFLEANVVAGKTYYSIVTPRMGFWKARFSIWPIRNDGTTKYNTSTSDFKSWLNKTHLVKNTDKSIAWSKKHHADIVQKMKDYLVVWKQKSDADLAERTLNPDDGV